MSRDGTYILKYHPGVAANSSHNYVAQDMDTIQRQSPDVEFTKLKFDTVYFEMPKYTLTIATLRELHTDQVLESCDGDDFVDISGKAGDVQGDNSNT